MAKYSKRKYARKSYSYSRRKYAPRNTISIPYNRKSTYRKEGIRACEKLIKKKLKYTLSKKRPDGVKHAIKEYVIPNKGQVVLTLGGDHDNGGIWKEDNIAGMAKHAMKKGYKDFSVYDKNGVNTVVRALVLAWGNAQTAETLASLKRVYEKSLEKKQKMETV